MAGVGREVTVTTLSGSATMIEGEFRLRGSYTGLTRYKNLAYYEALSDSMRISQLIGSPVTQSCEIVVETLSRDECEVFPDPTKVAFKGGPDNPIQPGSSLSRWHISTQDDIKGQVKSQYSKILTDMGQDTSILREIPLASSPIFTDNFSRGYIKPLIHEQKPVPQARYHCGINELIDSYKKILHVQDVEFRIHGTTYFPMEIMHSVIICPAETNQLDARFPKIPVHQFSERGQARCSSAQSKENISIERNENGKYRIIWSPFCTRTEGGRSFQWDNLTFGFFLPPNGPKRFPLPVPHLRQDKFSSDQFDTEFGRVIEVTRDDDSEDCAADSNEENDVRY